jgi:leucyl-tRNA synthetase
MKNGVDPAKVIKTYGAETACMSILFKAPPEKDLEWDDAGNPSVTRRQLILVTRY